MITTVTKLGSKGDGTVIVDGAEYFVPYVIDGEQVEIDIDGNGNRATLKKVISPSPKRVSPACPLFGVCGACKLQHLGNYEEFKTAAFLKAVSPVITDNVNVMPARFITGNVRRRALLKVAAGIIGFFKEKSNTVVPVKHCPLLKDEINAFIKNLRLPDITADLTVTLTANGLDVDINGKPDAVPPETHKAIAKECRTAIRLTIDGKTITEKEKPYMTFGKTKVRFPVGSFLQPSEEGEKTLLAIVKNMLNADGKKIADIFCGMGTFTFPTSETAAEVTGFEASASGVHAINTAQSRNTKAYERDLFKNPLTAAELDRFDAVLMDPPRDGAIAQSRMFKKTKKTSQIIYISCNPSTFTRDAKAIIDGGFALKTVVPVDQFRYTPHIELVADFRRI